MGVLQAYLWLCTVINELPNQLLALLKAAPQYQLGVRGQIECLFPVRPNLDKTVVCRLLGRSLVVQRLCKGLWGGQPAGVPQVMLDN